MARHRRTTMEIEEVTPTPNRPGGDNWDFCVKAFMDSLTLRNLSAFTKKHHNCNFRCVHKILTSLDYPTAPLRISTDHLKQVILKAFELKLSPTTINHFIRTSQQFFAFLLEEGYLLEDPAKPLKKVKAPKVIIEAFTVDQVKDLFAMPNKKTFVGFRDYCIMLVLLDTGVRLSELLNMRLDDVDLQQRKIKVMGKGAKERYVFFNTTTRDALKKYMEVRGRSLHHSFLWISREDGPLKRETIQERLAQYGQQAGLKNVRVSPHTFRHSFAKLFILNGGNTLALQNLLGHSTLEMVRHYVNLWGTDLQAMHRQFSPVDKLF